MSRFEKSHEKITGGFVAALVFIAIISVTLLGTDKAITGNYSDIIFLFASVLLAVWCVYIDYRLQLDIVKRLTRSFFIVGSAWIILRYLKRFLTYAPIVVRYFSYLYSLPMLALGMLFFILVFEIFFSGAKYKRQIYISLAAISVAIFLTAITNEMHFLFLRFPFGKDVADRFEYGPFFYLLTAYFFALLSGGIMLFVAGTAKRNRYSQAVSPFIVLFGFFCYFVLFLVFNSIIESIPVLNDIVVMSLLFMAGLLEVCMQCGLIQNGGRYIEYLNKSMLPLCIIGENGDVIYKTHDFNIEDWKNRKNPDLVFTEKIICDAKVVIQEDIKKINRLRRQAEKQNARLKRSNELLARSRAIKEEQAALKARHELYDEIENAVSIKVKEIEALSGGLPDELNDSNCDFVKSRLADIRLRIGYLKQKSMLVLMSKTDSELPEAQFRMIVDVIKSDVRSAGLSSVAFTVFCGKSVPVVFALSFNDFVEYIAENFSSAGAALFITVNAEKNLCVANVESEKSIELTETKGMFTDFGYKISCCREENEYRVTMKKESEND